MVHHHHGAVVQVPDPLVVLLAFLQNQYVHALAGQDYRLESVGQVVDVEHVHVMQVSHLVQVKVVGHDLGLPLLGQLEQLQIHFADGGKIVRHNLHQDLFVGLHALQHIQAAASALALGAVGRVGYHLELSQHKLGHHQHAVNKTGLRNVGDAAVDDDARIQHFGA